MFDPFPIAEKKGCFSCHLKPMCKINDELAHIHQEYNILGINLSESAAKWCIYLQEYNELRHQLREAKK